MIIINDVYLSLFLNQQLKASLGGIDWKLCLFTNDIVPDIFTEFADFVEPTWPAYSPTLGMVWTIPVLTGLEYVSNADPVTFTNDSGSPSDVYGYFVLDDGDQLVYSERDPNAPVTIPDASSYTVIPRFGKKAQT